MTTTPSITVNECDVSQHQLRKVSSQSSAGVSAIDAVSVDPSSQTTQAELSAGGGEQMIGLGYFLWAMDQKSSMLCPKWPSPYYITSQSQNAHEPQTTGVNKDGRRVSASSHCTKSKLKYSSSCAGDIIWNQSLHSTDRIVGPGIKIPPIQPPDQSQAVSAINHNKSNRSIKINAWTCISKINAI